MSDKKRRRPKKPRYPLNETTQARIKTLMFSHGETQPGLAEALTTELWEAGQLPEDKEISTQKVGRWVRGENGVSPKDLRALAKHWHTTPEYLTGETDIRDPIEYFESLEAAKDEALNAYYEEERAERARLENLFFKCGFQYTDISDTGAYMFGPAINKEIPGPHCLYDRRGIAPDAAFSIPEMEALLGKLHDVIAFECYKKSKEGENNGLD